MAIHSDAHMSPESRDAITWTLGTFLSLCVVVGLATRYVLLPYLRDHLVGPVREVQKQVTENHHATPEQPTLPDRLEDLSLEIQGLAHVMDVHMRWSEEEHNMVHRKLKALRKQARRTQERMNGEHHAQNPTT
jgi:hypothetical protein